MGVLTLQALSWMKKPLQEQSMGKQLHEAALCWVVLVRVQNDNRLQVKQSLRDLFHSPLGWTERSRNLQNCIAGGIWSDWCLNASKTVGKFKMKLMFT